MILQDFIESLIIAVISIIVAELFRVFAMPRIRRARASGKKTEFAFGSWRKPFVKVYIDRTATLKGAAKMFSRATPADTIYGQCKTCSDYPKFYLESLANALQKNVSLNMLVSSAHSEENLAFAKELLSYKNAIIKAHEFGFLRYVGIKDKEVIIVVTQPVSYVGVHIFDKELATYIQKNFEEQWNDSRSVPLQTEE
jgi:hypothetical protein